MQTENMCHAKLSFLHSNSSVQATSGENRSHLLSGSTQSGKPTYTGKTDLYL